MTGSTQAPFSLSAKNVTKTYHSSLLPFLKNSRSRVVIRDANISISTNEIVVIIGESGSGKTTLARTLLGLIKPTDGVVSYNGKALSGLSRSERLQFRGDVQAIFQNPHSSLNPRHKIKTSFHHLIRAYDLAKNIKEVELIQDALASVELPVTSQFLNLYPHQISGGQQQRVAIAKAFLIGAKLIIADEPLASLDIATQKTVLKLMFKLKRELGMSFLIISHDLYFISHMADRILVMYNGDIVEEGAAKDVLAHPKTEYTKELFKAALNSNPHYSSFR